MSVTGIQHKLFPEQTKEKGFDKSHFLKLAYKKEDSNADV